MTDFLDEIKERVKQHYNTIECDSPCQPIVDDINYLIRRLEEREYKVKELNEKLKRYKK